MGNPSRESRDLICTVCPLGCRITTRWNDGAFVVEGNTCSRGDEYAHQETIDPRRVIASTVRIRQGTIRRLPVRTSAPFPLAHVEELMQVVNTIEVDAPVHRGTVLARNLFNEGIDLLATRTIHAV